MTRNRARKMDIRVAAGDSGSSYTREARLRGQGRQPIFTATLYREVLEAFRRIGWPVEAEELPEYGQWTSWPGPVQSLLSRPGGLNEEADPDDPDYHDLTEVPAWTFIGPRIPLEREAMVLELPGTTPVQDVVAQVRASIARARAEQIARQADDARCPICDDTYPAAYLLASTDNKQMRVCPACAFDGDLFSGAHPLALAYHLDLLFHHDFAFPAGWTAVAALLACAGGRTLRDRLNDSGALWIAAESWAAPGQIWVPLPPRDRPAALAGLEVGASLAAVVAAVDAAHPDLRDQVRARMREYAEEYGDDDNPDYFVEQLWPAAVAYAVCMGTQAQERPGQRPPWHVRESFDLLSEVFEEIGSDLDGDDLSVVWTLGIGMDVVAEALGFLDHS